MNKYHDKSETIIVSNAPNVDFTNPKRCVLEATDAEEQANNLKDWQQQYDQISSGQFYGCIEEVSSSAIHAFREHTSQAIRQQCNVSPDSIWLGFSANEYSCRINGHKVSKDTLMIKPGNTEFELVTPEQFDIYGIVINQNTLIDIAEKQNIRFSSPLNSSSLRDLEPNKLNILRRVINEILIPEYDFLTSNVNQDNLIGLMLELLQQGDSHRHEQPSFSRRRAVVHKVKEYIQLNPNKQITITELCELAHVSRRTLQYSFEDVLGMSPLRYLRISRLNAVRRDFIHNVDHDETISSLAERWGFWHAGQFTHDYTQLFGENPSKTRLRLHNSHN